MRFDLISRSALKKAIKSYADDQYAENEYLGEVAIMDIIDNAPAIEYTFEEAFQKSVCEQKLYCPERPQGEWIFNTTWQDYECNNCHNWVRKRQGELPNFCGNCGADMRGKEND